MNTIKTHRTELRYRNKQQKENVKLLVKLGKGTSANDIMLQGIDMLLDKYSDEISNHHLNKVAKRRVKA